MVEVGMLNERVRTVLISVITGVWVVSIGLSMVNPAYDPDPSVNAVFALVIGTGFGLGKRDSNGSGNGKGKR
jgi:uncharacterized membrane protein YqgA involved in biofilm formation